MLSRILVSIGGLLVVALFGALIAPLFVDWTDFRSDFEREASRIMGKPVIVHGSVDARLLPFPSVTLNDVRVGVADDGEPLIRVARFSMDAELAPFLSGEVLIFDMRLENPKARIRLLPDGTLDWARGKRSAIPGKSVVLENVSVTDGTIDFIDDQTGRTRRVTDLSADLSAQALTGPWRIDGRAALDGETGIFSFSSSPLDAEGALGLRARLIPDKRPFGVELDGKLKVVDLKPLYQGSFKLVENASSGTATDETPGPRVAGMFELTNERIRVPEYRVELGSLDDPYLVTGEATLDTGKVPEFLLVADGQQIDVSRIGTTGRTVAAGTSGTNGKTDRDPAMSVSDRLSAIMAIAADIPIPQVPGRASLKLPAIVIGDTTVRDVRVNLRPDGAGWQIDDAVAVFPGRTQLEAKGRLTLAGRRSFRGDLLVASNQPSGLATWLAGSVDPAIRRLKTAGFSATVNLTDTLQQFERLEVAAGPATLNGRIERQSPDKGDPSLSIQLKGNRIDLEALRALAGLVAGDASSATVLSHAIAADLSADSFVAFGEEAGKVQAVLTLKNGQLQAERVSIGDLAGARLAFSGRMGGDWASPVMSTRMKLAADDLAPFLALVARHAPAHPALARLAASGPYFRDAALDLTLTAGGQEGRDPVNFGIIGMANGSRIAANFQAPSFSDALAGSGIVFETTLENPSATVLIGQVGFDPLPFDTDSNGILSVKVQATGEGKANASMSLTSERTTIGAYGTIDLSADRFLDGQAKLTMKSQDLEPYLLLGGISLPQIGAGLPLTLDADVTTLPEAITLSGLSGTLDRNEFSGTLVVDRTVPAFKVNGDLALDTVDLDWLAEGVLGPIRDATQGGLSEAALPGPVWSDVDVNVGLSAQRFWPGFYGPVTGFSTRLSWKGDEIELSEAEGDWIGGKAQGTIRLGNGGGSGFLQAQLDLTGGDLAQAGWMKNGMPVAQGRFDAKISLEASGPSPSVMAGSTSGSGEIRIDGLKVRNLNTQALSAILGQTDTITTDIQPDTILPITETSVFSGETSFDASVIVPFTIAGGTLRATSTGDVSDPHAVLSGEATLSLPEQRIDARLAMAFRAGDDALAGAEPKVEIGYEGVLATPGTTLTVTDLANFISLRAFERERRRVETLQANVLEKQRLRREVALYRYVAETRERERIRSLLEDRRRRAAADAALRLKAEGERLAAQEAARQAELREAEIREAERRRALAREQGLRERTPSPPRDRLPTTTQGAPLDFDILPDIGVDPT